MVTMMNGAIRRTLEAGPWRIRLFLVRITIGDFLCDYYTKGRQYRVEHGM